MGSLARKLRRKREKPKHHRRGGFSIRTPRVAISLRFQGGHVYFSCPECRQVLYAGTGTPHRGTSQFIERHVGRCQARKCLIETLELVVEGKRNGHETYRDIH